MNTIFKKIICSLIISFFIFSSILIFPESDAIYDDLSTDDNWTITGTAFSISGGFLHGSDIQRQTLGKASLIFSTETLNFSTVININITKFDTYSIFYFGLWDDETNKTEIALSNPSGTTRIYTYIINAGTEYVPGDVYSNLTFSAGIYKAGFFREYISGNDTYKTTVYLKNPSNVDIRNITRYVSSENVSSYDRFIFRNAEIGGDTKGAYSFSVDDILINTDSENIGTIEITSYPLLTGIVGETYYYDAYVSYQNAIWSLNTNCSNLAINQSTGVVSGIITVKGQFYVNISVTDGLNINYQNYTLISHLDLTTIHNGKTHVITTYYSVAVQFGENIYIVYTGQGSTNGNICIVRYNGSNWSEPVVIAQNPTDIEHGGGAITIDNDGYLHVFYGCHNSLMYYKKSATPLNITSWISMSSPTTMSATYPSPWTNPDTGIIYLFFRGEVSEQDKDHFYIYSNNNGNSWSSPQKWLDSDIGDVAYGTYAGMYTVKIDDKWYIHQSFHYYYYNVNKYRNIFYMYMDVQTNDWYSMSGYNLGPTITESEANTYCKVLSQSQYSQGWVASIIVDVTNTPYIVYQDLTNGTHTQQFIYWDGTGWTSPEILFQTLDASHTGDRAMLLYNSKKEITLYCQPDGENSIYRYKYINNNWIIEGKIIDLSLTDTSGIHYCRINRILNGNFGAIIFVEHTAQIGSSTPVAVYVYGEDNIYGTKIGFIENGTILLSNIIPEPEPEPSNPSDYLKVGKVLIILAGAIPFIGFIIWALGKKD